jgi:hypothetical protein
MISTAEDTPHLTVYESWQLNQEKYKVADAWLKAWNETAKSTVTGLPIDGLLLPPSVNVAHLHGQWPRYVYPLHSVCVLCCAILSHTNFSIP